MIRLMRAVKEGKVREIKKLKEKGVNLNVQDNEGNTALMNSIYNSITRRNVIDYLLE